MQERYQGQHSACLGHSVHLETLCRALIDEFQYMVTKIPDFENFGAPMLQKLAKGVPKITKS